MRRTEAPPRARSSIRRRVLLAVSLPFVAVVTLTAATFVARQEALETRERSLQALENELVLEQLRTASHDAHLAAVSLVRTRERPWRAELDEAVNERADAQARLSGRLADARLAAVSSALREHDRALQALFRGGARSRLPGLERAAAASQRQLDATLERVAQEQHAAFRDAHHRAEALNSGVTAAGVLLGVVGLVGGVVAVGYLSRGVAGRLRNLQANAERLGSGLPLVADAGGTDELASLARTLQAADRTIREKDDLLDLALEAGSTVIFETRPGDTVTLRGEPALLEALGLEGPTSTTSLESLRRRLESDDGASIDRLPNGDLWVRGLDGQTRWLEVRSRERTPRPGQDSGVVVGVVSDVTTRVQAQAAVELARQQAVEANRTKDDFLSRMSHELRTPLNAVLGFAQLLSMDDLDEEQRESVQHILKGGRHLLALVNDVLDLARIESGRLSLSVEPTRLADVVEEAIHLTRPLARDFRVELRAATSDSAVHALVDRRRMKQVLLNLLSNGIKYNRPGGHVDVSWSAAAGRVRVCVRDSGIGLDETQREHLFVPFARSDSRTPDVEGSGLGLAVSRSLVEAMGGTLSLHDSGEGGGSTFVVEVPESGDGGAVRTDDGSAEAAAARLRALGPLSVLHVEDNAANRRLVAELLHRAGSRSPVTATNGRDALQLARDHRPDVVLLDRHLPDMLGEDVLRELRADEATAAVPVVVVSADAMERSARVLLRSGADAFVTKPIDAEEFWRTVADVVSARGRAS